MKTIIKYLFFLIIPALLIGNLFVSCDDDETTGDPVIHYVRVTNPAKADSLLVKASMGNLIVLVGENLGDVVEVWFNDQQAVLSPTYITNKTIFVSVPSIPPQDVTNKITLVLRDGSSFQFDFEVTVPPPAINSIKCEYVPDGGTVVLHGDYFFEPEVIFPGGLEAEIVSFTQQEIEVIVPEGSTTGQIEVKTLFGSVRSSFYFRDNRGLIVNFDDLTGGGWHYHAEKIRSTDPAGASGNYYNFAATNGSWAWDDANLACDIWGQSSGRPEGPLFEGGISDKAIRFEANVIVPWGSPHMMFIFMPWNNNANGSFTDTGVTVPKGLWRPYLDEQDGLYQTDGWVTVTIPLSEFIYTHGGGTSTGTLIYPDGFGSLTVFMFGSVPAAIDPAEINICIDNIRVVPL